MRAFNPSLPGLEHKWAEVINWDLEYFIAKKHESLSSKILPV